MQDRIYINVCLEHKIANENMLHNKAVKLAQKTGWGWGMSHIYIFLFFRREQR